MANEIAKDYLFISYNSSCKSTFLTCVDYLPSTILVVKDKNTRLVCDIWSGVETENMVGDT